MSYHVPDFIDANPFNIRHGFRLLWLAWSDRAAFDVLLRLLVKMMRLYFD